MVRHCTEPELGIEVSWPKPVRSPMARTGRNTAAPTRATARTTYLKGRAAALRELSDTIDIRSIRDRVLALAEECVQLAKLVEREEEAERSEFRPGRRSHAKR
jgi:hypothetical protein